MNERATLKDGQWFEYPVDSGIPNTVTIHEGERGKSTIVRKITRMQAIALKRWYGHPGIYWSIMDGNGHLKDVRLVGDVDAWLRGCEEL